MNRKQRRKSNINLGPEPQVRRMYKKIGRNDLCPCGSGKKFKDCECYNHSKIYFNPEANKDDGN